MTKPIHIHPDNPRIFKFREKPLILICATEHYGAVMNRPFNYRIYLEDTAAKSQTLSRLFLLYRELQSPPNPVSTCKPETPDYVAPFLRVGPERAMDFGPVYDLDRWNPEFFERLHGFLSLANKYGIIVEISLFGNQFVSEIWQLCPLHYKNNINSVENVEWIDFMTMRHRKLLQYQCGYVTKIVQEVNQYDNVFFEICNEPFTKNSMRKEYPQKEINDWQMYIADLIRKTESRMQNQHLIASQAAWIHNDNGWIPIDQPTDASLKDLYLDIINVHPMPNVTYQNRAYDLAEPLSKKLTLRNLRDYCLSVRQESKPINLDEDNAASCYLDMDGWTIHRKRAWTTLLSGCHYDMIDFSINKYLETGTPESQRAIRTWMKNLSDFIHSMDIVQARPVLNCLKAKPEHIVESVLAVQGRDYCIYLADERELGEIRAGGQMQGEIAFELPAGNYNMACYSPVTGLYSPWINLQAMNILNYTLPVFENDIVVRIVRC